MPKTNPFNEIAVSLKDKMQKQVGKGVTGLSCELGTITATGGLKLDNFKHEIRDYLVADWLVKLTLPAFSISGTQNGLKDSVNGNVSGTASWTFSPTTIDQVHIELKPDLNSGDRVLCVPVNNGLDVVIISKVVA